jgi:CubicO group peptidase (beta-lactamase class C family)
MPAQPTYPPRVRKPSLLLVATIVASFACGGSAPTAPVTTTPPAEVAPSAEDAALGRRLDEVIDKAIAENRVVGTVILVSRDGKLVYHRAAGLADREAKKPMREDTIFRLASMTKAIVSVAALALVDQGKLGLDDPVTKYLPAFRPKLADGREPVITVKHLITHTSGLTYKFTEKPDGPYHKANISDGLAEPGFAMEENLRRLASVPLLFEPGTKWEYGLSVDVLGAVVAAAGGGSLPDVVRKTVTAPLDMTDTAFDVRARDRLATPYADGVPPALMTEPYDMPMGGIAVRFAPSRIFDPKSFPSGGAGMAGTAADYLRFLEAIRSGGAPILKTATVEAMTTNQLSGAATLGPGYGFGLGVGIVLDPAAAKSVQSAGSWSWAGIYGTQFAVDPSARLSVVVMTNTAGAMSFSEQVEGAIWKK